MAKSTNYDMLAELCRESVLDNMFIGISKDKQIKKKIHSLI